MLKPTVGIELFGVGSQTGRHEEVYIDLLYGKFSALASISSAFDPQTLSLGLTARTRRRDVLPAFCRPIMVTSISVALVE